MIQLPQQGVGVEGEANFVKFTDYVTQFKVSDQRMESNFSVDEFICVLCIRHSSEILQMRLYGIDIVSRLCQPTEGLPLLEKIMIVSCR